MLSRRLHLPTSILIPRPTSTWLYYHKRNHNLAYTTSISASTLPPSTLSTFPFYTPHPHILSSADFDSCPDVELEKHLGSNRNLDHDPSSLQRHASSSSHGTPEKNLKRFSSEPEPSSPPPTLKDKGKKKAEITDREWEIRTGELTILRMYVSEESLMLRYRTPCNFVLKLRMESGRAIFILQQTLPDFFSLGLVSNSIDNGNGKRKAAPNTPPIHQFNRGLAERERAQHQELGPEPESIYSPKIRLVYTPPVRLPSPFPTTLHVEGAWPFRSLFNVNRGRIQVCHYTWLHPYSFATPSKLYTPTSTSSLNGSTSRRPNLALVIERPLDCRDWVMTTVTRKKKEGKIRRQTKKHRVQERRVYSSAWLLKGLRESAGSSENGKCKSLCRHFPCCIHADGPSIR